MEGSEVFETADDVLEHFGVKGMRWGVRNEDDSSGGGSSKSDKPSVRSKIGERNLKINTARQATQKARAAKADIRISELKTEIAALPPGIKTAYKRSTLKQEQELTIQQRDKALKKAEKTPTSGLTSTQKKVLIGAAVAAVIVGAKIASNRGYDAEGIGASIRSGRSMTQYGDVFRRNESFAAKMSPEEVRKLVALGVNPNYATSGGQMNCRRCTFAYELRRRGYDVVATPSPMGIGQNESGLVNALVKGDKNIYTTQSMSSFASAWNEAGVRTRASSRDTRTHTAFTQSVRELSKLKEALGMHPDGARGEAVFDMGGFAHSMQWENFNGVPHIFDSQKGAHYPVTTEGLRALTDKWGMPSVTEITRLDNVDLDMGFLGRWARNG